MSQFIMAIDQGTTSSRAIIFDQHGRIQAQAQAEFPQYFPNDGWVEHNAKEILEGVIQVSREVLQKSELAASDIAAIGITNQRETTVVWDRDTGEPVYNAIVWQDRRTARVCEELTLQGKENWVNKKTGLLLDPYFSATKLQWILNNVDGARERAQAGELAFGTIDSYLLWSLTGEHKTDVTNASRTMLFNIHELTWDNELLELFDVPSSVLPEVCASSEEFGYTREDILGAPVLVGGMVGDQQGALIGQACFHEGMAKSTYGTGCFLMQNTGTQPRTSHHRLLTTIAYQVGDTVHYALEGSIFMAGATIQWIRDGLKLIGHARETLDMAKQVGANNHVYMVPAFTGLGAPYWDPDARGAIMGLTRDTGIAEIVTAGLQSVCYQTRDLLEAMAKDKAVPTRIRVDGGMVVNDWVVQFLADILQLPIERPEITETTALGAAYLAAISAGQKTCLADVAELWQQERSFEPNMERAASDQLYDGWLDAVGRVRSHRD
ncbi:glycerol kinase GlpK [Bermanella marisrubri]|uniref:Glycerol kinase n=1 Tax=Bermanella marisrubri TaxID=207949 RepID=Q1N5V9_9GAMM|nr:glycerol kinase GlpK [Bermanella marisrubri]EAT13833.1 probable carbohydrate kinase [Oceanobacter sp. RED65] [Bermanella marisrubri]QIZ84596.1 glycerol kinase GlpK [Bermanella marisrubri]